VVTVICSPDSSASWMDHTALKLIVMPSLLVVEAEWMLSVNDLSRKQPCFAPMGWRPSGGLDNAARLREPFQMSDHGRAPVSAARSHDGDRRRFLRCVAAVTGSRQVTWTTSTGSRDDASEQAPRR
ncbi:MAG: hypothetical protein ABWY11_16795, partial [Umezawaea sp.]